MNDAFICDAVRTPFARYGGALAKVRPDDLGATPIKTLLQRNTQLPAEAIDDIIYGCANQAGEDNRNVARMCALLAGLPVAVTGVTINRLCGSGLDAVGMAARAIKTGEAEVMIAGGVESMSRAPFVMPKASSAFSRQAVVEDTTLGWRFINPVMKQQYGIDSMPETAENVAHDYGISRADQDVFALYSQQKAQQAQRHGYFDEELTPVFVPQRKASALAVTEDEHPRAETTLEGLNQLPTPFRDHGTVTAGNASGLNDGACALLIASQTAVEHYALRPMAKIVAMASAGVEPRVMGIGPVPAIEKVLLKTGLSLHDIDIIELNEAFAAQSLAVLRQLGLADNDARVNPQGGAIALGHPLGASGARLVTTAAYQLQRSGGRYALCTMCIGVGQGIALIIERCQ